MRSLPKEIVICLASGIGYGLAWPPVGIWILALVMPGLFFSRLLVGDRQELFIKSISFFTGAWFTAFFWIAFHPVTATAITSVLVLFTLACVVSLFISLLTSRASTSSPVQRVIFAAGAWFLFDLLLLKGPIAMPWVNAGLSAADSTWALEWVKIGGVSALSLLVLSSNASLALILKKKHVWVALAILSISVAYPFLAAREPVSPAPDGLTIGIVQPNWTPSDWAAVTNESKSGRLLDIALDEDLILDAVLFPETALPIGSEETLRAQLSVMADSLGAPVFSGGILQEEDEYYFNVVVSSMASNAVYKKRRMVPFAERVPFSDWIPFFERFSVASGGVSTYQQGAEMPLVHIAGRSAGILICFESLFFRDALTYRRAGAELILIHTQDGWWSSDSPRRQHFAFSRLLAAASGLPVIQSSVDGISGFIDSRGNVISSNLIARSRTHANEVLSATLSLSQSPTLYYRFGDWPIISIFFFIFLLALVSTKTLSRSDQVVLHEA